MTKDSITLFELNSMVAHAVKAALPDTYCVTAEISRVSTSPRGHCYLELIEKSERGNTPTAKASAMVPASIYPLLKLDFEQTTGQSFSAGIKVKIEVRVTFNELYGYSLMVLDIDPTFTMGDMARRRKEILDRLEREGVMELNKSLELPMLINRIAVVSSPTAAGYGDFIHQLDHHRAGYRFEHKLFPAIMQGEQTESSIIQALDAIANEADSWDVVVIIRGGGAVSDLHGFETYDLANNVAQFPLPVFTGVGHERDTTVIDFVAHTRLKTPTAVADFLINIADQNAELLTQLGRRLSDAVSQRMSDEQRRIALHTQTLRQFGLTFRREHDVRLASLHSRLVNATNYTLKAAHMRIDHIAASLQPLARICIEQNRARIEKAETRIAAHDPQHILALGYSLTLKDGKAVCSAASLKAGDKLSTRLADGWVDSIVTTEKDQ